MQILRIGGAQHCVLIYYQCEYEIVGLTDRRCTVVVRHIIELYEEKTT